MSGGEEDEKEFELKDLIVQTLEANGLLSKLKAQIRASVFIALDESDKNTKNLVVANSSVKKVLSSSEGRVAASLVREFLEKCSLDFTVSVFDPELNSTMLLDKREKLFNNLRINENDRDIPVLVEVLKQSGSSSSSLSSVGSSATSKVGLSQNAIDAIKLIFDTADSNKRGYVDEETAKKIFYEFFPNLSKNILESYLVDEFNSSKVDFQKFISTFNNWYSSCQSIAFETEIRLSTIKTKPTEPSENNGINELISHSIPADKKNSNSAVGELPPLFNSFGNGNNKSKMGSVTTREFDKKFNGNDNYDDDFTNSAATPRTPKFDKKPKNRSGIVSDDEIDENLSYIEESSKIDEVTIDRSISTIQGTNDADYIEDVSI